MSGRGNSGSRGERLLRKLTVLSVFLFVLFQFSVFVVNVVRYEPHQTGTVAVVHDTVYIRESTSVRSSSVYGGNTELREDRYNGTAAGGGTLRTSERQEPHSGGVGARRMETGDGVTASGLITEKRQKKGYSSAPDTRDRKTVSGSSRWKWDVVELNSADSAALDDLPGIGGYYAKNILRYRERLGAFTEPEQLLEIRGMDSARFARLATRVRIDSSYIRWIDLTTVTEETLACHPYVGKMAARGIIRLRESIPPVEFSLDAIIRNGIMSAEAASRLARYLMK